MTLYTDDLCVSQPGQTATVIDDHYLWCGLHDPDEVYFWPEDLHKGEDEDERAAWEDDFPWST